MATRGLLEVVKEMAISLGMDIAFKKFTEKTAERAGTKISEVFEDKRAELLVDLLAMPAEDTNNLWRWHRETPRHMENRFAALLCKIPKDHRLEVFAQLNRLTDKEFQQVLNLLEHDVLAQVFLKAANAVCGFGRKINKAADAANKLAAGVTLEKFHEGDKAISDSIQNWRQRQTWVRRER